MSDEAYDLNSRFLRAPPPESHHLLAAPGDEPVASHVVEAPQDVPAAQMGVALAPLLVPPPNPDPAFGFPAALTDNVEFHQALAMTDVQPPQSHNFPDEPAPAAMASNNDDPVAWFEALFDDDGIVLPDLETMSLFDDDDQFMDDVDDDDIDALIRSIEDAGGNNDTGIGSGVAEHTAVPRAEDYYLNFVPFVRGELDCSHCRSVREMLHESANHKLHFAVHAADSGTFQHAIFDCTYIDADGQTVLNEAVYLDLRQRMHEWVQNFIANSVQMLKNDTSGQLKDSCSTSSEAVCTNIIRMPEDNDPHMELEIDMLKQIFSSPTAPTAAVALQYAPDKAPQPVATRAEENINTDGIGAGIYPTVLEPAQVSVGDGVPSTASSINYRVVAKQRERIAQLSMLDILNTMHLSTKDAAKELNISTRSLKRLCRKFKTHRWPARKIISINNKIKKLEQAAQRNVGLIGLLEFMEKLDKLKLEKEQLYASILNGTYTHDIERPNGGAGPSGSK